MKKVKKSFPAVIITLLIGAVVPNVFKISNSTIENKFVWKLLLVIAFWIPTIIVGKLFSKKIIKSPKTGGKLRINIYLLIVLLFCIFASAISLIVEIASKTGKVLIGLIFSVAIFILLVKFTKLIINRKKQNNFISNLKNNISSNNPDLVNKNYLSHLSPNTSKVENSDLSRASKEIIIEVSNKKLYTIDELWDLRDTNKKCITISNDENPNLKWVKIYKPKYNDGNFYGFVMMDNARETINGIIYFADQPIWYYV